MNIDRQLNSDVMGIYLDEFQLNEKKLENYALLVASDVGNKARAFMRVDHMGNRLIELWNRNVAAREAFYHEFVKVKAA